MIFGICILLRQWSIWQKASKVLLQVTRLLNGAQKSRQGSFAYTTLFKMQMISNAQSSQSKISNLQETLSALPEYQLKKAKFSLHTDLCHALMKCYNEWCLEEVTSIEQELATGETSLGKPPKSNFNSVLRMLDHPRLRREEKLRLVVLFLISQNGTTDADRQQLLSHAGLGLSDIEAQAMTNLSMLGVRLSASFDKSRNGIAVSIIFYVMYCTRVSSVV